MTGQPLEILLIERIDNDASLVEDALSKITDVAPNVERQHGLSEALPRLADKTFDAILLDLTMPDVDDAQAIRSLRENAPDAPIIIMTDVDDDTRATQLLGEGAQYYMTKASASPQLLSQVIPYVISQQKADQEMNLRMQASERALKESAVMAEIGRTVVSSPDLNRIYARFCDEVRKLLPFDALGIVTIDNINQTMRQRYRLGIDVPENVVGADKPLKGSAAAEVAKSRRGVLFEMSDREEILNSYPATLPFFDAGLRCVIAAPLLSQYEAIGVIYIGSKTAGAYSTDDVELTERIAAQIAGAISNAKLHEDLQKEAQQRQALSEIGRVIGSSLDINEVYDRFAEQVGKLIPFDSITVALIDPEKHTGTNAYVTGPDVRGRNQGDTYPLKGTVTEHVWRNHRGLIVDMQDKTKTLVKFPGLQPFITSNLLTSFMSVPLVYKDDVLGALHLQSNSHGIYSTADLKLFEQVAAQIVGAIANSMLHLEIQREAREREVLASIGRVVGSSLDLNDVFEQFAEEARNLIPFDRIVIGEVDLGSAAFQNTYISGIDVQGWNVGKIYNLKGTQILTALRSGKGMVTSEVDDEQLARKFPDLVPDPSANLISMLMTPLISIDGVIGAMTLRSVAPNAYSERDLELASRIATQITGAVVNSRLYADRMRAEAELLQAQAGLERRVDERTTELQTVNESLRRSEEEARRLAHQNSVLAEISRIITSSPNIEEVYDLFVQALANLLPFDRIAIASLDREIEVSRLVYASGEDIPDFVSNASTPIAGSPIETIIQSRAVTLIQVNSHEELVAEVPSYSPLFQAGIRSFLTAPLISDNKVIGVLAVRSKQSHAYDEEHVYLMERVAAQVSGAIAKAQLNEALQRESREREVLAEIGRVISSSLDISEVYEQFTEHVQTLIPFDRISISTLDSATGRLTRSYVMGAEIEGWQIGDSLPSQESLADRLRHVGRGKIIDCRESPTEQRPLRSGLLSALKVPLAYNDNVIGFLVMRSKEADAYTSHDLSLAERIAAQIAGALANSKLHESLRREAEEREVLAEIGRIITSSLDINEVYELFTEQVRRLIPFDRISLNMVDKDNEAVSNAYVLGIDVDGREQDAVFPLSGTFTERVCQSKAGIIINADPENLEEVSEQFPGLAPVVRAGINSFLGAPMFAEGEVIGVLNLRSTKREAYNERDLALLERVAAQISGAIVNARLHEDVRKAREAAEDASIAKSQFLANMSHEMRTPLNGVAGMIDLIYATELTDKQKDYLRMMKTSSDALLDVINDTLDISKIEAGRLDLESIEFNVRELVGATVDMLAIRAQRDKGLEIVTDINDVIPPILIGDPTRLRQILVNLISNAIKFTDEGGINVRVGLDSLGDDNIVCHFEVEDTGIGIPLDKQEIIFDSFSQADSSTTRRYGGTGLGLAISLSLVDLMDGRIWVESEIGEGSAFHFTARFGLSADASGVARAESLSQDTIEAGHSLKRSKRSRRILLAEDNRINQVLAVSMLENWGHSVVVVTNGAQAIEKVESERFDLILMDVQMPGVDGVEATRIIREKGCRLPIVAMTAHTMAGDREQFREAGMDGYISKPINANSMYKAVEDALDNSQSDASNDESVSSHDSERRAMDIDAALRALRGSQDLLNKMGALFLEETEGFLKRIHTAVESRHAHDIERAAHSIKGAVGIFSAERAFDLTVALEQAGREEDLSNVDELHADLRDEIRLLASELREMVASEQSQVSTDDS